MYVVTEKGRTKSKLHCYHMWLPSSCEIVANSVKEYTSKVADLKRRNKEREHNSTCLHLSDCSISNVVHSGADTSADPLSSLIGQVRSVNLL